MKYKFLRADSEDDPDGRMLIWRSEPLDRRGTVEEVFCREAWFWAKPNGRWMIQNQAEDECGFRSLRFTPTYPGATNDCYVA